MLLSATTAALALNACAIDPEAEEAGTETQALAASSTGQGIMVDFDASGTYALVTNQVWRFDQEAAAAYFTNAWDGVAPTSSCSGNACNGNLCGIPAAPAAPAADPDKVVDAGGSAVADKSRCTFLDGGTLVLTDSYTQSASVSVSCTVSGRSKSATYNFAYTYAIAPDPATAAVAPFTAWNMISETGDGSTAHVDVTALIAGESVLSKANMPRKYSFSIEETDPVTLLPVSRVRDLLVSFDGAPGIPATSSVSYPIDFAYATNAGTNGNVSLLADGDARTILNTDSFAGNNDGGADGSALAAALMDPVGGDLGAGDHLVTLTGTVKGNSAAASVDFSVTQIIHVITPGCGQ
ncbi:MAG TPA: hypothetical protein VL283_00600 [Candidatus Baltobacteraceae bacterium]|nr:hypothetical protein [Candidatus Baltobacteraceae bacterium]